MTTALIGCAGWGVVSGSSLLSGAEGSQLERYASELSAVEINSSFYRGHHRTTYSRWAFSVPQAFRFSVKLPRTITHTLRLEGVGTLLTQFRDEVEGLGEKLGCILVQLPPSLQLDRASAARFFEQLRSYFACTIACEARHASWFGADASALLKAHAMTRVIADPPKGQTGTHIATTSTVYMRLHGAPRMYYSSYSATHLEKIAADLTRYADDNRLVWLIFDNTASGAALANALEVLRLAG